jgi:hypothetical protein
MPPAIATLIQNLISAVLGFQYFVDVILGIFLLVSFSIGLKRGFWKATWRLIFVGGVFALVYTFALPYLSEFFNSTIWSLAGLSVSMNVAGVDYAFTTIGGFFSAISTHALAQGYIDGASLFANTTFLTALSLATSRLVAWFASLLVMMIVGWIISGLLWAIIIGPILKSTKGNKAGFLGALVGTATGYVYALLFAIVVSPISATFGAIDNATAGAYNVGDLIPSVVEALAPERSIILSLGGNVVVTNPFGLFTNLITFESEGTTYNIVEVLVDFVNATETPVV